jgi:site-specific recombinase XerD
MCNLSLKIEDYNRAIKLADSTKKRYLKALEYFSEFLSQKLKCDVKEIDLKKISVIRSKSGDIYLPIKSNLLDEFLFENTSKGYHELVTLSCALKSFFKYLYRNENFPEIVSKMKFDLKKIRVNKKPIRILSKHEVLRFFHSLVSHSENVFNEAVLFSLLFSTGMRISELLKKKVQDIDFESEMLILEKTKNKKARIVALRNGFGDVLKYYCSINDLTDSDYLFKNRNGQKISQTQVRAILRKYLEKANLPFVRIHSIRHSFATHMLDAGSSIFIIQQLLGHEWISSTRTYTNPNNTRNKDIVIKEHEHVYRKIKENINAILRE